MRALSPEPDSVSTSSRSPRPALYYTIWRWHFYAGLIVIPFVLFLSVTGGIYLFRDEIDDWLSPQLRFVQPQAASVPADDLAGIAVSRYPGSHVSAFASPKAPGRSAEVHVKEADGNEQIVYLNPHTGSVLGAVGAKTHFTQAVRDLHGKLLLGKAGQFFVEVIACWAFVLIVTGLYLWWPRSPLSVWGTLIPRLRQSGRTRLRDLHSVTAVYLSGLVLFLIVTGLPWAPVGAEQVKVLQVAAGELNPPDLRFSQPAGSPQEHEHAAQDWLEKQALVTLAAYQSEPHAGHTPLSIGRVVEIAESQIQQPYEISMPKGKTGVYVISNVSSDPRDMRLIYVEQYTGEVVGNYRYSDFGLFSRSVSMGVAIHEGTFFGLPNQLLGLVTVLGLSLTSVFGFAMWWKRRPKGRLGVPKAPQSARQLGAVTFLVLGCAVVLPLVGASLICVGLLDRFIISRVPRLKFMLS